MTRVAPLSLAARAAATPSHLPRITERPTLARSGCCVDLLEPCSDWQPMELFYLQPFHVTQHRDEGHGRGIREANKSL